MRRSTMRLLHFSVFIGLIAAFCATGFVGCIPAFRGLQPVPQQELKPKKKPKATAEILFHKEFRKVRYGQIGTWGMTSFVRVHERIRFNNRKGFKYATKVLRGGKITALKVRTVCPDGRVTKMGLDDIQQITKDSYSSSLWSYSSKVTKFTAFGVGVGCVTDFFWERDVPQGINSLSIALQHTLPVHKAEYTWEYGARKNFRASLKNADSLWMMLAFKKKMMMKMMMKMKGKESKNTPVVLTDAEKKKHVRFEHKPSERRLRLWLNDIPARPRMWPMMAQKKLLPPRFMSTPKLTLALVSTGGLSPKKYLTSWKDLDAAYTAGSAWYWDTRSSKQRFFQMDEDWKTNKLAQVARKFTQKLSTREAKMKALYYHLRLRMIRTSPMGTYSPRKLYLLYQLKRASRYEINMMFIVMLRAIGIRAYPVLMAPRNRTYQNQPPSNPFRTVLAYVSPKSEGAWKGIGKERSAAKSFLSKKGSAYSGGRKVKGGMILDPSNKYLPLGVVMPAFTGVWGFVIDGAGGRMVLAKSVAGKKNQRKEHFDVQVAKDGTLTGTYTVKNWGSYAVSARRTFANTPKYSSRWKTVGWAKGTRFTCFPEAEPSLVKEPALKVRSLEEPFVYSHKFVMRNCLVHGKRGLLFKNWLSGILGVSLRAKTRVAPIYLSSPKVYEESFSWSFPVGFQPRVSPFQKEVKAAGIKGFMSVSKKGNSVQIARRLTTEQLMLPPSAYGQVQKVFGLFKTKKVMPIIRKVQ